jgi:hypothetical protein
VAQGRKAVTVGGATYVHDPFRYLVLSSHLHFQAEILGRAAHGWPGRNAVQPAPRIWWRQFSPPNLRGMPPSCVTRWPRSSTPTWA